MRLLALLLLGVSTFAQAPKKLNPAKWTMEFTSAEAKPGATAIATLTATIDEPWHMYSPTTPPGGPMITRITLADTTVAESMEIYRPQPVRKLDPNFGIEAETYDKQAVFFLKMKLQANAPTMPAEIQVNMRYQVCTEKECLPQRASAKAMVTGVLRACGAAAGSSEPQPASSTSAMHATALRMDFMPAPVPCRAYRTVHPGIPGASRSP